MPKILNRVGTLTISLLINYVNQERALNSICKNRFLALSSLKTNSNASRKEECLKLPKEETCNHPGKEMLFRFGIAQK